MLIYKYMYMCVGVFNEGTSVDTAVAVPVNYNERSAFKPLAVLGSQWGGFFLIKRPSG